MSLESDYVGCSMIAGADLSAKQYHAMIISGINTCTVASAATDTVVGVLQNTPTSGQAAALVMFGRGKVKIGGNVTYGQHIGPDTDAMGIAVTADGKKWYAIALESGVDGDVIDAFITVGSSLSA